MALNDDAVFTAARGYIYTGVVDLIAPTPTQIDAFTVGVGLPTGWTNIGHTSRDDLPEFGFEGGEFETRGTWQTEVLKEVQTQAIADFVTFNLHQFDEEGLSLYYGVANAAATAGIFRVTNTGTTTTDRAMTVVVVDGATKIALYAPKVGIRRADAIKMAVDEFSALPLRATFLKSDTAPNDALFEWITLDTGINA